MPSAKPPKSGFRDAKIVSEEEALAAFAAGDIDRVRYALIDGSRCLADEFIVPHALRYLEHESADVRWAAVFALDQGRRYVCELSRDPRFIDENDSVILTLKGIASDDPAVSVRRIAATTLGDIIGFLEWCLENKPGV